MVKIRIFLMNVLFSQILQRQLLLRARLTFKSALSCRY